MKRMFMTCVLLCLMLIIPAECAFATMDEGIMPTAENYVSAKATIAVENNQIVVCGKMYGISGKTTKVEIQLYLQQYNDGRWVSIKEWDKVGNGASCVISETSKAPKGYKYRARAICCAYAGGKGETTIKYSNEIIY